MLYANENDIMRCTQVIQKILEKNNLFFNEALAEKIAIDVMRISLSKGGDYSEKVIRAFAEVYISKKFYTKFLKEGIN